MPRDPNVDFLAIIKDVFSPDLSDYGFTLQDEVTWNGAGEYTIIATKSDIDLNFHIGISPMFYYCSMGIKLSGEAGEKATPHAKYRSMDISTLAEGLDPNYKRISKGAQTKEEVKESFEAEKDDLLTYCKDILLGDVSSWTPIANQMAKEWEAKKNSS